MEFNGKLKNIELNNNQIDLTLSTTNKTILEDLKKYLEKDKELNITIKRKQKKRSLDSNSLAWYLMEKIAEVMNSDKDLVYLDMLSKYGVFTHVVVKPIAVERVKKTWKLVKELGEVKINGTTGIQLQCYFGSSTFTQQEMSRFINGIKNECRDLDIPTPDDEEIENLIKEWNV